MTLRVLLRFLLGQREAILTVASARGTLPLGALFVLSAGLAREYDGEDLLAEPWHLAIPFVASLASSFVLYFVIYGWFSHRGETHFGRYPAFLGMFWLTAPLAWFYAIPYERFLDPTSAANANIATLACVAAWRVFLMVRVGQIILHLSGTQSFLLVINFAMFVALAISLFTSLPLLATMGGVRLAPARQAFAEAGAWFLNCGILIAAVFLISSWSISFPLNLTWRCNAATARISPSVWVLAWASLVIWSFILPWTQAEQWRRTEIERLYAAEGFGASLARLQELGQSAFPPHWDPPPHPSFFDCDHLPELIESLPALDNARDRWLFDLYLAKVLRLKHRFPRALRDPELRTRTIEVLSKIPEAAEVFEHWKN